eukprot:scaffold357142_cov38-Prasinocladus_malaysianus.AAC.1
MISTSLRDAFMSRGHVFRDHVRGLLRPICAALCRQCMQPLPYHGCSVRRKGLRAWLIRNDDEYICEKTISPPFSPSCPDNMVVNLDIHRPSAASCNRFSRSSAARQLGFVGLLAWISGVENTAARWQCSRTGRQVGQRYALDAVLVPYPD